MNKKDILLGVPQGTAANKLRKSIMFEMAKQLCLATCFRCKEQIISVNEFSIEHKEPWEQSPTPLETFLDLSNIAFSHHSCNCAAARRPTKKYASAKEARRLQAQRHRQTEGWRKTVAKRKEKRRIARLVVK
jgi:hypothetical protein